MLVEREGEGRVRPLERQPRSGLTSGSLTQPSGLVLSAQVVVTQCLTVCRYTGSPARFNSASCKRTNGAKKPEIRGVANWFYGTKDGITLHSSGKETINKLPLLSCTGNAH
ncbi:hypothetical protein PoB_005766200 [Plakobranchus ocellatus]|uniref:Uncharacterized protein n=1 Tax=Plakobranchus ocellatus TaxID=259542 RepID=A0AAV4CIJ1_9GAST|nr:hypothetical protein PoB_005766200 [Plakobranchus ocellatus]